MFRWFWSFLHHAKCQFLGLNKDMSLYGWHMHYSKYRIHYCFGCISIKTSKCRPKIPTTNLSNAIIYTLTRTPHILCKISFFRKWWMHAIWVNFSTRPWLIGHQMENGMPIMCKTKIVEIVVAAHITSIPRKYVASVHWRADAGWQWSDVRLITNAFSVVWFDCLSSIACWTNQHPPCTAGWNCNIKISSSK